MYSFSRALSIVRVLHLLKHLALVRMPSACFLPKDDDSVAVRCFFFKRQPRSNFYNICGWRPCLKELQRLGRRVGAVHTEGLFVVSLLINLEISCKSHWNWWQGKHVCPENNNRSFAFNWWHYDPTWFMWWPNSIVTGLGTFMLGALPSSIMMMLHQWDLRVFYHNAAGFGGKSVLSLLQVSIIHTKHVTHMPYTAESY